MCYLSVECTVAFQTLCQTQSHAAAVGIRVILEHKQFQQMRDTFLIMWSFRCMDTNFLFLYNIFQSIFSMQIKYCLSLEEYINNPMILIFFIEQSLVNHLYLLQVCTVTKVYKDITIIYKRYTIDLWRLTQSPREGLIHDTNKLI